MNVTPADLTEAERRQIVIVGSQEKTWIHSPTINWVTVALLVRRHMHLFRGFPIEEDPHNQYFRLSDEGRAVCQEITDAAAD